jgi:hypothetical protein
VAKTSLKILWCILLSFSPLKPNLLREILEGWNRNNNLQLNISLYIRLFLKPFLYFNILSIIWQLLLSVKWRHLFSCEVKTRPIYFVCLYIVTVCVFVRHLFSFYPFYFDFHSARIIVDMSSGFYLWNINKTTAFDILFDIFNYYCFEGHGKD